MSNKHSAGKGDKNRTTNYEKYRENFDRIFSAKKKKESKKDD